jgi:hypothetical protein
VECAAAVKEELLLVGGEVRDDATRRFWRYSTASAAGFQERVRAGGLVRVEQALRKTTGKRPDFGALMVTHAMLPARDAKLEGAVAGLEGRIAAIVASHGT